MTDCPDTECSICTDDYNKSTRRPIKCVNTECGHMCCMSCLEKWSFSPDQDLPKCMNCSTIYPFEFIKPQVTLKFMNQTQTHRATMLCSREKSLLPITQTELFARTKIEDEIAKLREERRKYIVLIRKQREERLKYIELIRKLDNRIYACRNTAATATATREVFSRSCPDTECKGFISSAWKCAKCEKHFCKDCHTVKNPGHVCNEDTKATIALLKKDTKSCPKCECPITKISGCDQMYCTKCFTAFSWNTGKIVTGLIHNPHYFELNRINGRQPARNFGDLQCGGIPDWTRCRHKINRMITIGLDVNHTNLIKNAYRMVGHITDLAHTKYHVPETVNTHKEYREQYLLDLITEEMWIRKLKARLKKTDKINDIRALFDVIINALTDILQRFVQTPIHTITTITNELNILLTYSNTQFSKIGVKYNNKPLRITPIWLNVI